MTKKLNPIAIVFWIVWIVGAAFIVSKIVTKVAKADEKPMFTANYEGALPAPDNNCRVWRFWTAGTVSMVMVCGDGKTATFTK